MCTLSAFGYTARTVFDGLISTRKASSCGCEQRVTDGNCCTLRRSECCSLCLYERDGSGLIESTGGQLGQDSVSSGDVRQLEPRIKAQHVAAIPMYMSNRSASRVYLYIVELSLHCRPHPPTRYEPCQPARKQMGNCPPSTGSRKKASHPPAMHPRGPDGASQRLLLALVFLRVVPAVPELAAFAIAVPLLPPCSCVDCGSFSFVPLLFRALVRAPDPVSVCREGSAEGGDSSLTVGTASLGWVAARDGCSIDSRPKASVGST